MWVLGPQNETTNRHEDSIDVWGILDVQKPWILPTTKDLKRSEAHWGTVSTEIFPPGNYRDPQLILQSTLIKLFERSKCRGEESMLSISTGGMACSTSSHTLPLASSWTTNWGWFMIMDPPLPFYYIQIIYIYIYICRCIYIYIHICIPIIWLCVSMCQNHGTPSVQYSFYLWMFSS